MSSAFLADVLAAFVADLRFDDLPIEVVDKAKLCVVDCLSSNITIANSPEALALQDALCRGGEAVIFGSAQRAAPDVAALVNGVSAAATCRNDTHPGIAAHPGMCVIPAILALAESVNASGKQVIEALVAGYEVMIRVGLAVVTPDFSATFRPTGWLGAIGAGAAAAKILGLDQVSTCNAISLATNCASGFSEWALAGTNELVLQSGQAAHSGVVAALLAQRLITSSPSIFEGAGGMLRAFRAEQRAGLITDSLGQRFEMLAVQFKAAPACIFAQGPSQLAARLADGQERSSEQIDRVDVFMPHPAAAYPGCDQPGPYRSRIAASASVRFSVASILAAGDIYDANWDCFDDPDVATIADRTHLIADDALTSSFPTRNGTRIDLHLSDGTCLSAGQPDLQPMSENEIVTRFRQGAGHLCAESVDLALASLRRLEAVEDINQVTSLLSVTADPNHPSSNMR